MKVVVATHNAHKLEEIRAVLSHPGLEFVSLANLGITEEPLEDADDFVGNARIKARFAHERTGLAALADDSGLMVDALEGAPGVHSSRYAGQHGNDAANNQKLLARLEGLTHTEERSARFVCALVFLAADGTETVATGELCGRIALEPRGAEGFGYDPLFLSETYGYQKTLAEVTAAQKNSCSHRARALLALQKALEETFERASQPPVQHGPRPPVQRDPQPSVQHASAPLTQPASQPPVQLAVFDFDGTLIDASSPVRLIARLNRDHIMPKKAVAQSILWGVRYKMGREMDQVKPRRTVFSSFKNFSASDANAIMKNLYCEELRNYLRPRALQAIAAHRAAGHEVMVVSASFEPIITALCEDLHIEHAICTHMEVVDGAYTGEVAGIPPESEQKLFQFVAWADNQYGAGGWELAYAYGDHFSDIFLMETAAHPVAIDPDRRLAGIASDRGWEVYDWPLDR